MADGSHWGRVHQEMFTAINAMLLDMLAAVARKDYEDRRRRQAQGIVKAKAEGCTVAGRRTRSERRHSWHAQVGHVVVVNPGGGWV